MERTPFILLVPIFSGTALPEYCWSPRSHFYFQSNYWSPHPRIQSKFILSTSLLPVATLNCRGRKWKKKKTDTLLKRNWQRTLKDASEKEKIQMTYNCVQKCLTSEFNMGNEVCLFLIMQAWLTKANSLSSIHGMQRYSICGVCGRQQTLEDNLSMSFGPAPWASPLVIGQEYWKLCSLFCDHLYKIKYKKELNSINY